MSGEITPPADAVGPGGGIAGYRLEEQIGEGGMAVVYRARDERLGRLVALKLLAPGLAADTGFRQRFINESRAAAAVDHPNIIPIYEAGDAGGSLFIAMRYVQGGDVRSLLERHGPLPAARAWAVIRQVAAALDAAHAHGLIHRDVKPANMLVDAREAAPAGAADGLPAAARGLPAAGQPEHVYLSDFGISKQPLSAAHLTMAGQFVGTLDYIAPEQIGGHLLDGRADLYSLGCAAFELLSGMPPFRRDQGLALVTAHLSEPPPSLTAERGDLPAAVDRVLAGAMAKSPDERYATCAQFATDLGRALGLVPGEPEPPGTPRRGHSPAGSDSPPGPWPATELAGQTPRPAAGRGRDAVPAAQHDLRQPPRLPGPLPATPVYRQGPTAPLVPAGPSAPGWQPQPPGWQPQAPARRSRGLITGVIVAAVAIAVAAVAAAIVLAGRSRGTQSQSQSALTSPAASSSAASSAPPSPSAEATAVSNLLTSGATSSVRLTNAVDNVQACADLTNSVQQIRQVRDQRQTEYDQARNLSTGALQNGTELKLDLTQSLLYSLSADNDYLTWAQQQASGCQQGSQSSAALAAGSQAVGYKTRFVSLWNPIAARYALPPASVGGI